MSESKFTEGPWQSQHDFDMQGVCRIIGAIDGPDDGRFHYKVICEVDPDGSLDTKEQYANARLIAGAPDLYDALRALLDAGVLNPTGSERVARAIQQARDALFAVQTKRPPQAEVSK